MKEIASPNPSFDDFFLQEIVADLEIPLYTGDFPGSDARGRSELEKLQARLKTGYELLLDTISVVREPDTDWTWDNLNALISSRDMNTWQAKWGNPGAWYAPISLPEFEKHAVLLYLVYQAYYHELAGETRPLTFYYGLLLHNPDFTTREGKRSARTEHIERFKSESKHVTARVQELLSTIIDHEVQHLRLQYRMQDGFSLRSVSLIPIMYYQMGVLLRSPESARRVRRCVNCSSYFWGHGNRRYCYRKQCDRRIVHKQKQKGVRNEQEH